MGLAVSMAVIIVTVRGVRSGLPAWLAEEGQEECAEDVEGGHAGGENAYPIHPGRVFVGRGQDRVLTVIARKRGHAGNGDAGAEQGPEGDRCVLSQAAHFAQVLFAGHGVDHAAGSEE